MIVKSFKYILLTGVGLLLCSCTTNSDREYENFIKIEEEKIRNELVLLEKQKQANQQEMLNLQKQREQLKKERQLSAQEKTKIEKEKKKLFQQKKQINNNTEQQEINVKEQSRLKKIKLVEKSGKRFSCDELMEVSTTSENCTLCPNRKFEEGMCVLKECPEGYFPIHSGTCFHCSTNIFDLLRDYEISREVCDRCPEREYKNGRCVLKECPKGRVRRNWLLGPGPGCPSCASLHIIDVTEEECNKCPNRIYKDEKCILKECPKDYFFDTKGECHACSTPEGWFVESTKESCEICSNREYKAGFCVKKCSENQFLNSSAKRVDCFTKVEELPMKNECNKCPNRVMKGPFCALKECPKDFPMRDSGYLRCEACDFPYLFDTSPEECAKCPNREMKGNYCVLK